MLPRYTLLQFLPRGRVKAQVRLQASQQRKKGTVKTQAYNTPATNSDTSLVHPLDDSVWETVKAEARHSPATCTFFSTIHSAADSAWKNLKAESVPVRDTSDKVIIQDGRSDPAARSFEEFRLVDAGICLAALRCPHCPTWLSHRSSLRNHILRFHEPPPPTSSPVLSEWSFSEADAVEEGKQRRQRGPRFWEARQRRLGRSEPNTIGHEEFTILHSNVRAFISRVAELSARLRLMESKPSVLCLTETWADKGLPSLRIEGYTLISRRDRDDGRLGGGVAVFSLEKLAHRVTLFENSQG